MKDETIVATITRQGTSHARTGRPNEDSVCIKALPDGRGIVTAASDGAGSAPRAKEGSQLAAHYSVQRAVQAITEEGADLAFAVKTGLMAAREALKRRSELIPGAELEDYHCTLILIAWVDDQVAAAQVGDGAAIAVNEEGDCRLLTVPQQGEYANTTYFLTGSYVPQMMRAENRGITAQTEGITSVALFTDGIQKHAINFREKKADAGFIPRAVEVLIEAEMYDHRPDEIQPLPPDTEINSIVLEPGNVPTDAPEVGKTLFRWLQKQVGDTTDDMSLILAARRKANPLVAETNDRASAEEATSLTLAAPQKANPLKPMGRLVITGIRIAIFIAAMAAVLVTAGPAEAIKNRSEVPAAPIELRLSTGTETHPMDVEWD